MPNSFRIVSKPAGQQRPPSQRMGEVAGVVGHIHHQPTAPAAREQEIGSENYRVNDHQLCDHGLLFESEPHAWRLILIVLAVVNAHGLLMDPCVAMLIAAWRSTNHRPVSIVARMGRRGNADSLIPRPFACVPPSACVPQANSRLKTSCGANKGRAATLLWSVSDNSRNVFALQILGEKRWLNDASLDWTRCGQRKKMLSEGRKCPRGARDKSVQSESDWTVATEHPALAAPRSSGCSSAG